MGQQGRRASEREREPPNKTKRPATYPPIKTHQRIPKLRNSVFFLLKGSSVHLFHRRVHERCGVTTLFGPISKKKTLDRRIRVGGHIENEIEREMLRFQPSEIANSGSLKGLQSRRKKEQLDGVTGPRPVDDASVI